ncbi:hypothetical protein Tco_0752062 [Tanacetum coccineum]|uniref:Uncharacterized protein n=1 Tax=Tanacetum coccineum TaxID=301880 RepID=A0ABQ4Z711_9ASTR
MVQAKLKTLDALSSLLNKVTEALNQFAQVIASASKKTKDANVPLADQVGTKLAEGENNTNQATIFQLFQRKATKDANLNKQQSIPTSQITTTATSTTILQSFFLSILQIALIKTKGGGISKMFKGKKALYGDHVHLTEEQIKEQKRIEESAKSEVAKHEVEVRKEVLVDLLGPVVVSKLHHGLGHFDHARTFSSLLLAEVDKRNFINQAEESQFESLRKVQLQFFWYLEDQDHLHFSLCGDIETEDETLARDFQFQLGN